MLLDHESAASPNENLPDQVEPNSAPVHSFTAAEKPVPSQGNLETSLRVAMGSRRYLVAVFHVADGRVQLYRQLDGFPHEDLPIALNLLRDDLASAISTPAVALNAEPLIQTENP